MLVENIKFIPFPSQEYVCNNLSKLLKKNNCVVINDEIGTGKTVSLLLWIYKQKLYNLPYKIKIIASNSIIYQWKDDLDHFFHNLLNYKIITNSKENNLDSYDIIVCNYMTSQILFHNDFICFDEFSSVNCMTINNKNNIGKKSILISSDDYIAKTLSIIHFFENIKIDVSDLEHTINISILPSIKTTHMNNFNKPNKYNYRYTISDVLKASLQYLSPNVQKIIKENDVKHAIEILISDLKLRGLDINLPCFEDDMLTVVKLIKITEIDQLVADIDNTTLSDVEKTKIEKKIKITQIQVEELTQRYDDIISGVCNICCGNLLYPFFYSCCQNVVCENCKHLLKKCPYCRSVNPKLLDFNLNTLSDIILSILQKIEYIGYIVIFRYSQNSMNLNLSEKFGILKGTAEQKREIIRDYKNGTTKILFLSILDDFSGLRLENTTDIIFLDKPCENVEKQIIGRALRFGRNKTLPLNLHYLSCD
uniref:RING-type domain-containing protein n=1 Tax=viral metagenome TaxID=1070528 RepID=A0A6C0JDT3_9ZZZZ